MKQVLPLAIAILCTVTITVVLALEQKHKPWDQLSGTEKKTRVLILLAGLMFFIIGVTIFLSLS